MPRKTEIKEDIAVNSPLRRSSRKVATSSPAPASLISRRNSQTQAETTENKAPKTRRLSLSQENTEKDGMAENKPATRGRRGSTAKEDTEQKTPAKTRSRRSSAAELPTEEAEKKQIVTRRRRSVVAEDQPEPEAVKPVKSRRSSVTDKIPEEDTAKKSVRARRNSAKEENTKEEPPKRILRSRKSSITEDVPDVDTKEKIFTRGRRSSTDKQNDDPDTKTPKSAPVKSKKRLSITENAVNLDPIEELESNTKGRESASPPNLDLKQAYVCVTPVKLNKAAETKSNLDLSTIDESSFTEESLNESPSKKKVVTPRKSPRLNKEGNLIIPPRDSLIPSMSTLDNESIADKQCSLKMSETTDKEDVKSEGLLDAGQSTKPIQETSDNVEELKSEDVKNSKIVEENLIKEESTQKNFNPENSKMNTEEFVKKDEVMEKKDLVILENPDKIVEEKENTHTESLIQDKDDALIKNLEETMDESNSKQAEESNVQGHEENKDYADISMGDDVSISFHLNVSLPSTKTENMGQDNDNMEDDLNTSKNSNSSDKENITINSPKDPNVSVNVEEAQKIIQNVIDTETKEYCKENRDVTRISNVFRPRMEENSFMEPMDVDEYPSILETIQNKTSPNLEQSNVENDPPTVSTPILKKNIEKSNRDDHQMKSDEEIDKIDDQNIVSVSKIEVMEDNFKDEDSGTLSGKYAEDTSETKLDPTINQNKFVAEGLLARLAVDNSNVKELDQSPIKNTENVLIGKEHGETSKTYPLQIDQAKEQSSKLQESDPQLVEELKEQSQVKSPQQQLVDIEPESKKKINETETQYTSKSSLIKSKSPQPQHVETKKEESQEKESLLMKLETDVSNKHEVEQIQDEKINSLRKSRSPQNKNVGESGQMQKSESEEQPEDEKMKLDKKGFLEKSLSVLDEQDSEIQDEGTDSGRKCKTPQSPLNVAELVQSQELMKLVDPEPHYTMSQNLKPEENIILQEKLESSAVKSENSKIKNSNTNPMKLDDIQSESEIKAENYPIVKLEEKQPKSPLPERQISQTDKVFVTHDISLTHDISDPVKSRKVIASPEYEFDVPSDDEEGDTTHILKLEEDHIKTSDHSTVQSENINESKLSPTTEVEMVVPSSQDDVPSDNEGDTTHILKLEEDHIKTSEHSTAVSENIDKSKVSATTEVEMVVPSSPDDVPSDNEGDTTHILKLEEDHIKTSEHSTAVSENIDESKVSATTEVEMVVSSSPEKDTEDFTNKTIDGDTDSSNKLPASKNLLENTYVKENDHANVISNLVKKENLKKSSTSISSSVLDDPEDDVIKSEISYSGLEIEGADDVFSDKDCHTVQKQVTRKSWSINEKAENELVSEHSMEKDDSKIEEAVVDPSSAKMELIMDDMNIENQTRDVFEDNKKAQSNETKNNLEGMAQVETDVKKTNKNKKKSKKMKKRQNYVTDLDESIIADTSMGNIDEGKCDILESDFEDVIQDCADTSKEKKGKKNTALDGTKDTKRKNKSKKMKRGRVDITNLEDSIVGADTSMENIDETINSNDSINALEEGDITEDRAGECNVLESDFEDVVQDYTYKSNEKKGKKSTPVNDTKDTMRKEKQNDKSEEPSGVESRSRFLLKKSKENSQSENNFEEMKSIKRSQKSKRIPHSDESDIMVDEEDENSKSQSKTNIYSDEDVSPKKTTVLENLEGILDSKLDRDLSNKIAEIQSEDESYASTEESDTQEPNEFISSMAEEGEEDTPSEGSNDIIDEGESINSTESEIESDDYDENDSFICDEEERELLSGDEYDLSHEKKEKTEKKSRIIKLDDYMDDIITIKKKEKPKEKKRSRIITISDSSESELETKEIFEKDEENETSNINPEEIRDTEDTSRLIVETDDDVINLEELVLSPVCVKPPEDLNVSDTHTVKTPNRKRTLSMNIIENINVADIKDEAFVEKINSLVDSFCTNVNKGEISVNFSLEHVTDVDTKASPKITEDSDIDHSDDSDGDSVFLTNKKKIKTLKRHSRDNVDYEQFEEGMSPKKRLSTKNDVQNQDRIEQKAHKKRGSKSPNINDDKESVDVGKKKKNKVLKRHPKGSYEGFEEGASSAERLSVTLDDIEDQDRLKEKALKRRGSKSLDNLNIKENIAIDKGKKIKKIKALKRRSGDNDNYENFEEETSSKKRLSVTLDDIEGQDRQAEKALKRRRGNKSLDNRNINEDNAAINEDRKIKNRALKRRLKDNDNYEEFEKGTSSRKRQRATLDDVEDGDIIQGKPCNRRGGSKNTDDLNVSRNKKGKTRKSPDFKKKIKSQKWNKNNRANVSADNLRAQSFSIMNQLLTDIKNRPMRTINPTREVIDMNGSWICEIANVKPSTSLINRRETAKPEKIHPKDFRTQMLYDPSRVKRIDTKTLLRKKGAYI